MELSSRPYKDDLAGNVDIDDPNFSSTGAITYGNGPRKGTKGVRFTFEVPRANGLTEYEVTLTKEELLELVAALIN